MFKLCLLLCKLLVYSAPIGNDLLSYIPPESDYEYWINDLNPLIVPSPSTSDSFTNHPFTIDDTPAIDDTLAKNKEYIRRTSALITKKLLISLYRKTRGWSHDLPWDIIFPGDIINWPGYIDLKDPRELSIRDLEVLKSRNLEFSTDFVVRYIKKVFNPIFRGNSLQIIKDYLSKVLSIQSGLQITSVPWAYLSRQDIINWPMDVPFLDLDLLNTSDLEKVRKRLNRIYFSRKALDLVERLIK